MSHRYALISLAALLGTTACTTSAPDFQIRPVAIGSAPKQGTISAELMQANGYMALGSVGLALEGYRRTIRIDPGNVEAMMGMAECYLRMGRPDIAQKYSQMARAASPGIRRDPHRLAEAPPQPSSHRQASPDGNIASQAGVNTERASADLTKRVLAVSTAAVAKAMSELDLMLASPASRRVSPAPTTSTAPAMRLERISAHEVALVTSAAPIRQANLQSSNSLRRALSSAPTSVRAARVTRLTMLNAARVAGLAARTREALKTLTKNEILIGDAPQVIERTEIRYAADQYVEAQRLSRRLGVPMRKAQLPSGSLALWLGRDAHRLSTLA